MSAHHLYVALTEEADNRINAMSVEDAMEHDLQNFLDVKHYKMMRQGEEGVVHLMVRYGLEEYFKYFYSFNRSHDAPYHNMYHTYCMVLNCYEGAYHEKVSERATRVLLLAALFHDFDHTAGENGATDDINIPRAIEGLRVADRYARAAYRGLSPTDLQYVIETIAVTKYPYEKKPELPIDMIIRDADLMQPYETDAITLTNQYLGLKTEIERQRKTTFTRSEYAEGQKAWLETNVHWYTSWAEKKAKALDWDSAIERLRGLIKGPQLNESLDC